MKQAFLLTLLLGILSPAYALDSQDAGDYVLLNAQQQPTPMKMRFKLQGKQWVMDGKQGDGEWQSVCAGTGECKLVASGKKQIKEYQAILPAQMRNNPLDCIQNKAFAFCRMTDGSNTGRRLYWWLPLIEAGRGHALGLHRIQ